MAIDSLLIVLVGFQRRLNGCSNFYQVKVYRIFVLSVLPGVIAFNMKLIGNIVRYKKKKFKVSFSLFLLAGQLGEI